MLIGFIGIPSSGKTTLAAEVFASLKRMGVVSEFVVEIARQHIAAKRLNSSGDVVLTDDDQKQIMQLQLATEVLMSDNDTITVSDSSPLNALMYMTDECRNDVNVQKTYLTSLFLYDILVICDGIGSNQSPDHNRLHGQDQSKHLLAQRENLISAVKATNPKGLSIYRMRLDDPDCVKAFCFFAVDKFLSKAEAKT